MKSKLIELIFGPSLEAFRNHCRHAARLLRTHHSLNGRATGGKASPNTAVERLSDEAVSLSREIERLEDWRENLLLTEAGIESKLSSVSGNLQAQIKSAVQPSDYASPEEMREILGETQQDLELAIATLAEKRRCFDEVQQRMQGRLSESETGNTSEKHKAVGEALVNIDSAIDELLKDRVRKMSPSTVASMQEWADLPTSLLPLRRRLIRADSLSSFSVPDTPKLTYILSAEDIKNVAFQGVETNTSDLRANVAMQGSGSANGRQVKFDGMIPVKLQLEGSTWDCKPLAELLTRKAMEEFASGFSEVCNVERELAQTEHTCRSLLKQLRDELGIPRL